MKISGISNTIIFTEQSRNKIQHQPVSQPGTHAQISELPSFYYMPVSFTSSTPRTYSTNKLELEEKPGDFKISDFDNITCPACGNKMLTKEGFYAFKEKIDNAEPDEYLNIIGDYRKYMRPVEMSVYDEISSLSEDTGVKDLRKLLVMLRNTKLSELTKIQMGRVREMTRLARTLPPREKEVLLRRIAKLKQQIKRKNAEAPFRRKIMIDRISKIKISNEIQANKLQNIARSFPTSKDANSAWIVKYSGKGKGGEPWKSYDIALRMLASSVPNTDHIMAYSLEHNHDDISNYMAMHNGCNGQKSNKTLLQWVYENKDERIENLNNYFQDVQNLLDTNAIDDPKYDDYVANATETISRISKGKINISV